MSIHDLLRLPVCSIGTSPEAEEPDRALPVPSRTERGFGLISESPRDRFALGPEIVEGIATDVLILADTADSRQFLRSCTRFRRWCWNQALRLWLDRLDLAATFPEGSDERKAAWPNLSNVRSALSARIAAGDGSGGREDLRWAQALDSRAVGEAVADLAKAWADHRKNPGHFRKPKFQAKNKGTDSYRTTNDKVSFSADGRKVKLPKVGWLRLSEAVSNHGDLMSATISRIGDNRFSISFSFRRADAEVKRSKTKGEADLKHPRKPNPTSVLPSPEASAPERRRLGTEKPFADLLASIRDEDVAAMDAGQRTRAIFSMPITLVRHAKEPSLFEDPVEVSRTVVPTASGHRPGNRRASTRTSDGTVEKVVEQGTKIKAHKALAKAEEALARMQRKQAKSLEIPVPPPPARIDPNDPASPVAPHVPKSAEDAAVRARRKALRDEKMNLRIGPVTPPPSTDADPSSKDAEADARPCGSPPRDGRSKDRAAYDNLRFDIKARDEAKRRAWRAETDKKNAAKKKERKDELARLKAEGKRKAPLRARRTKGEKKRFSRIADLHRHVAAIRKDGGDRFTTAASCAFKCLVVENLDARAMMLAGGKGPAEMSFGQVRSMFRYKCALDGCLLIEANRWFPSSKRCSACGGIHADLARGDTWWKCPFCDARHDRDANAAENLAWYGRVVVRLLKGEDALSGLSEAVRHWFVGPARSEETRGETGSLKERAARPSADRTDTARRGTMNPEKEDAVTL